MVFLTVFFVFLKDACLLERVFVVTGFFAPVEAAFFFAAALAFGDGFLGIGCFDALAADLAGAFGLPDFFAAMADSPLSG